MPDSARLPDAQAPTHPGTEPATHAEAEARRRQFALMQEAPSCQAALAGPNHMVTITNKLFRQLFGERTLAGLPLRVALPELAGQPFFALLDEVYRTGATCYGHEEVTYTGPSHVGASQPLYFNFIGQAVRDEAGAVTGLLLFAYNVSAHVQARRQQEQAGDQPPRVTAQQLALANEELATTNEELSVSYEELATTNEELAVANEQLRASNDEIRAQAHELRRANLAVRKINQELEARVAERTAQLQDALRKTEQERTVYSQALDQTPAMVCLLRGAAHRFAFVNRNFQGFFLNRPLMGRPLAEALPETEAQGFGALLDRVYATGETYRGQEVPLTDVGPHGSRERFFDFTYQAAREHGEIVGVDVFAFDVTDQVRVRQQVAVAVFRGPRYVIELANPVVCGFWGRTAAQVLGKPLFEALPEVAGQGFEEMLDRVLATGIPCVAREQPATLDRAGRRDTAYYNFVYQPLRDAENQITGITVIATDATEQVLARQHLEQLAEQLAGDHATLQLLQADTQIDNAALSESNRQLTQANAALDNFVYAASHDLKLPLINLTGLFEELRRGVTFADPKEEGVLVPLIEQALHQLGVTLNDLATLGQAQQAAGTPAETVDLAALVESVLHTLEPQVRAAHARVTTDFAVRPTLTYSRASLHTVLFNLLSNSLKYADPTRPVRIHLSLWLDAGQPVLLVQDNGLGFDAVRHGPELFQLFRRFHSHVEGTGVGLYLVNRMVQAHGGRIEVESQVGEGTTFRVYLGRAR